MFTQFTENKYICRSKLEYDSTKLNYVVWETSSLINKPMLKTANGNQQLGQNCNKISQYHTFQLQSMQNKVF